MNSDIENQIEPIIQEITNSIIDPMRKLEDKIIILEFRTITLDRKITYLYIFITICIVMAIIDQIIKDLK
jgi:hypothetical protein